MKTCTVANCSKPHKARGLCKKHYHRLLRHGRTDDSVGRQLARPRPDLPRRKRARPGSSDDERLRLHGWSTTDSGCWEWSGARNKDGYGVVRSSDGRLPNTHRLAYEAWVGPIPEGIAVMHTCDNPPCINPEHLTLGTHRENMADKAAKGRVRNQHSA